MRKEDGNGIEPDMVSIRNNLQNAGVKPTVVEEIMLLYEQGDRKGAMELLEKQRCSLLDDVHVCQCRLDCLDFLLYGLRKKKNAKEK